MSIPANARVRAAPNFLSCLEAAHSFMEEQDASSAAARFSKLQAELLRARTLIAFAPTSGRPARFLDARSGWGQFQAEEAKQLARSLGMPDLRELVLSRHIVLYAHATHEAVLLSLRHERQLAYRLSGASN
ncbi:MAG: hypothetical protein JWP29_4826 [Rhodoferax sp.]|nr:hypothetical protein [Rhodoferax sp.]